MDKKKLTGYSVRLSDERNRLTKAMNRNRSAVNDIKVEHTEDEGDLAIISHDRELLYNLQETDLARLKAIDAALARLSSDEYGECVNCGEAINEKRLEAVPWVTRCIRCQEEAENELASSSLVYSSSDGEAPEM
jgi:DnaK suppressor protein